MVKPQINSCDFLKFLDIIGKKWTVSLFINLSEKPISFNELNRRTNSIISPILISDRLKQFKKYNLIKKFNLNGRIKYTITEQGIEFKSILLNLKKWFVKAGNDLPIECIKEKDCCLRIFQNKH